MSSSFSRMMAVRSFIAGKISEDRFCLSKWGAGDPYDCNTIACAGGHLAHAGLFGLRIEAGFAMTPHFGNVNPCRGMWALTQALDLSIGDACALFGRRGESRFDNGPGYASMSDKQVFLARCDAWLVEQVARETHEWLLRISDKELFLRRCDRLIARLLKGEK